MTSGPGGNFSDDVGTSSVIEFKKSALDFSILKKGNFFWRKTLGPGSPDFQKFHFVASPFITQRPGFKSGVIPLSAQEVTRIVFGPRFASNFENFVLTY